MTDFKDSMWWQEHHKDFSDEELAMIESKPLPPSPIISRYEYDALSDRLRKAQKVVRKKSAPKRAKDLAQIQLRESIEELRKHKIKVWQSPTTGRYLIAKYPK